MSLLLRSSLRYIARHPWQVGLAVLGVAIGVAVVVAVDIAASSARRAFELSAEAVTGRATHRIVGSTPLFSDTVYQRLRVQEGVEQAAPVVESYVGAPDYPGRTFRLFGIDPFAERPFRSFLRSDSTSARPSSLPAEPRSAVVSALLGRELGLGIGDTLIVSVGGRREPVVVAALIEPPDERTARALESVLIMDIAGVQEVLQRPGQLSAVDLLVPEGERGKRLLARVRSALPPGVEVVSASARSASIADMTQAFHLNLTALSLLALVVGMFLIYNTMTFSVVQRRPYIGRLRALGVGRGEIFRLVLGEAVVVGGVGTLLGCALGVALGRILLELVTQTINDLYYVVAVRDIAVDPLVLLKGGMLGLLASLLAALAPAHEATRSSPRSVFSRSTTEAAARSRAPVLVVAGGAAFAVGGVLLVVAGRNLGVSYAGLLLVLLGCALAVPYGAARGAALLAWPAGAVFGSIGRMAARGITATLGRTSVAIAALMIAISATIGVGVMVDSFRATVARWLETTLEADVYISPPGLVARRNDITLPPSLVKTIAQTAGVQEVNTVRAAMSSYRGRPFELLALRTGTRGEGRFRLKESLPDPWRLFRRSQSVFVSEPFAYRFDVGAGDTVYLATDSGRMPFVVGAVYEDFATDIGTVLMDAGVHARFWSDTDVTGVSVYADDTTDVDALVARLRNTVGREQPLLIRSNRVLRATSLEVFDRTFAVTSVLRMLTVVVAFVGVLSALMALQLERAREIGVLRATGMTPGQVWKLVTVQTGLMGFLAGVFAVPVGFVLAAVLIYVINKRSFGWTLEFLPSVGIPLQAVALAVAAALLAGLYPAWKMSRTSPAVALRDE